MKGFQTALAFYVSAAWAAPTLHTSPLASSNPPGPPGVSGSLRASSSLAGYDPSNEVPTTPSTSIAADQFELAAGQSEDKDLDFCLDLSLVENPQLIRGGTISPIDLRPR